MMKTYMKPEVLLQQIELQQLMTLSRQEGEADPNSEVLSRENDVYEDNNSRRNNVWEEEVDY